MFFCSILKNINKTYTVAAATITEINYSFTLVDVKKRKMEKKQVKTKYHSFEPKIYEENTIVKLKSNHIQKIRKITKLKPNTPV